MRHAIISIFLLVITFASNVFGWSGKEHILITRCAIRELLADPKTPEDMKQWLRDGQPQLGTLEDEHQFLLHQKVGMKPLGVDGLAYWSVMPDLMVNAPGGRDNKVAPLGVTEQSLHFVDLEYLLPNVADRNFATDLSHKPALAAIPRDIADPRWQKAGMLPFRIEDCYKKMVDQIRQNRLADKVGQLPTDEHATNWAGMLSHYAADNTMPMHATADYQAYSFFPEFKIKPKVHFDMEYKLTDDDNADHLDLREAFWKSFAADLTTTTAPAFTTDVWTSSMELSRSSYDALPLIGAAARAAYLDKDGQLRPIDANVFYNFAGNVDGKPTTILQMKAYQTARAVKWVELLWLHAWQESHETMREQGN